MCSSDLDAYLRNLQVRAKTDPAGVAKEIGMDYGNWTSQILNNGEATADQKINALVDEIQDLRNDAQQEREKTRQQAVERLNSEALNTVQQFRSEIDSYLGGNAEKYAGITAMGLNSLVYDLIRGHFQSQGKLLSVTEASDILEESVVNAVEKFTASKKWADRTAGKAKGTPPQKAAKPEVQEVRTVSNDMTAEAGVPSAAPAKRLNFQERVDRALASAEAKKAARI